MGPGDPPPTCARAIVAVSVVVASTVLSILSGYAFGLMRFPGSTALFYVFLIGLMVPAEALVVPLYFDLRELELTDTYWALILPRRSRCRSRSAPSGCARSSWPRRACSSRRHASTARPAGRPSGACSCLRAAGDPHDDGARLHVDLERVLARARDGAEREPPHGAARASVLPGSALLRPEPTRRRRRHRRDPVVLVYVLLQRHFIRGMLSGAVRDSGAPSGIHACFRSAITRRQEPPSPLQRLHRALTRASAALAWCSRPRSGQHYLRRH